MTDGRTHYDGCWREHHDCAARRMADLEQRLREAESMLAIARGDLDDAVQRRARIIRRLEASRASLRAENRLLRSGRPDLLERALGLLREHEWPREPEGMVDFGYRQCLSCEARWDPGGERVPESMRTVPITPKHADDCEWAALLRDAGDGEGA